jgi:hypothetical protein
MASGPHWAMMRRQRWATSSMAASQVRGSKRPLPLGPTRRRGVRTRVGP